MGLTFVETGQECEYCGQLSLEEYEGERVCEACLDLRRGIDRHFEEALKQIDRLRGIVLTIAVQRERTGAALVDRNWRLATIDQATENLLKKLKEWK